ncbi:hypothetical protein B0H14DRAFT_3598668 [Mycena olivaceomarginata]|nr:hypothetical protein B0H14DRAFT_3598668 [Mycena olivaceomarginata]
MNGTWLLPAPCVKVNLRKKPRLWDAWVVPLFNAVPDAGGAGVDGLLSPGANAQAHAGGGAKGDASEEKDDWDTIMGKRAVEEEGILCTDPLIFVGGKCKDYEKQELTGTQRGGPPRVSIQGQPVYIPLFAFPVFALVIPFSVIAGADVPFQPFAASYSPPSHTSTPASRLLPLALLAPSAAPTRNTSSTALALSWQVTLNPSTAAAAAAAELSDLKMEQPRVHVAVLIAMPVPGMFTPSSSSSFTSSTAPTPHTSTPQTPTWVSYLPTPVPGDDPDNTGLPHLEVGVVSVGVVTAPDGDTDREGEGEGSSKGVLHDSEDGDGGGKAKAPQ